MAQRKAHNTGQRGGAKKEAFHKAAEAKIQRFTFDGAAASKGTKGAVDLAAFNSCQARVQILKKGSKKRGLHYHPNMDQVYMVLKGKLRVYGPGDKVTCDLGPMEGIGYPENCRYWMEPVGEEDTWLMHISGYPKGRGAARVVDLDPNNPPVSKVGRQRSKAA
jgi:mannose-6-phosphate isomerase-like protein (cupin superfamily)